MRILSISLSLVCLLCPPASAGSRVAGFRFLEMPAGADAIALAGLMTSYASGPEAVTWNPAGLTTENETRLALDYLARPLGLRSGGLGIGSFGPNSLRCGFRLYYQTTPAIASTDPTGNFTGEDYRGTDLILTAAAARKLTSTLSFGAAAKAIHSAIDDRSAAALALDLGLNGDIRLLGLRWAVAARHLGIAARDYYGGDISLPAALAVSTSCRPLANRLSLGLDLAAVRNRPAVLTIGGQLRPHDVLFINFSHCLTPFGEGSRWPLGLGSGFGVGLKAAGFVLNYALREISGLGTQSALGLSVSL